MMHYICFFEFGLKQRDIGVAVVEIALMAGVAKAAAVFAPAMRAVEAEHLRGDAGTAEPARDQNDRRLKLSQNVLARQLPACARRRRKEAAECSWVENAANG